MYCLKPFQEFPTYPEKVKSLKTVTLQQLCMAVISESFSRYWAGYCCASRVVPSRGGCYPFLPKSWRRISCTRSGPMKEEDAEVFLTQFQLLQRIYLNDLVKDLYRYNKLKEEYLPFFIYKRITSVDLQYYKQCCWFAVEKQLLEVCETLTELTFAPSFPECGCDGSKHKRHSPRNGPDELNLVHFAYPIQPVVARTRLMKELTPDQIGGVIRHLRHVTTLVLSHTTCDDAIMKAIGDWCPHLSSLDISDCCDVTDQGLKNLFHYFDGGITPKCGLRTLHLHSLDSSIGDSGIAFLITHMSTLEVLSYMDLPKVLYNLHRDDDLSSLQEFEVRTYNITVLEFDSFSPPTAVDYLKLCNRLCPRVTRLNLYDCNCDQAVLDACAQFEKLDSIEITGEIDDSLSLDKFLAAIGPKLTSLVVRDFAVTPSLLTRSCPRLKSLSLNNVEFPKSDKGAFRELPSMAEVTLYFVDFYHKATVKGIRRILEVCPRLERLKLIACEPPRPQTVADILGKSGTLLNMNVQICDEQFAAFPCYPKLMYLVD